MSGKTAYLENAFLKLLFNGTAIPNFADNAAASPATTLYIRLHSGDPTDTPATEQTTLETAYAGYTGGQALARTSGGWTVTGNVVSPTTPVIFPACTGGTATISYASIGTEATGNGKMLWSGAISPAISVSVGVIPTIMTTSTITES